MARPRRRLGVVWPAALAIALATGVAGCVTVPTSGHVQAVSITQGGASQSQDYLQPIPAPPGRDWSARQIVSGFLAANASFASNHAVAREYLTASASRNWRPGWEVTVFKNLDVPPQPALPRLSRRPASTTVVPVSGLVLGSLSNSGQYAISSAGHAVTRERFVLVKVGGQWRISGLPPRLLLTDADFHRVYQSRNLYFFDPAMQVLVPDPVYVPQEATPTDLVTRLVQALEDPPTGWLSSAARTGFPAHTKANVALDGGTAIVNLGGAAAGATEARLRQISAQLLWTLAGSTSDQPAIRSVELEVNGTPWTLGGSGSPVQQIGLYGNYVPSAPSHASFYYADGRGAVHALSDTAQGNTPQGTPVPGQAGTGQIPLTEAAVSPDRRYVAGLAAGGTAIYTGTLTQGGVLTQRLTGSFTSLSWDSHDDLWAAGNGGVWMVPAGGGAAVRVAGALPAGDRVTALKVAPDGVRCAMIVTSGAGSQLMLAAIIRAGQQAYLGPPVPISSENFTALTWYDADHVIALSQTSHGPVLDEVAVNGELLSPVPAEQGTVSITADGSAGPLVAGLSNGQMVMLASLGGLWSGVVGTGSDPAYPG
ncbi:MAG TPA: LpqB family beta-propeller domain-containing protein [Streptosporangiaceae bacterium]|nr:LpqB family beta-propeller domain-containing protein [Streptosporangiaceae bacterium]